MKKREKQGRNRSRCYTSQVFLNKTVKCEIDYVPMNMHIRAAVRGICSPRLSRYSIDYISGRNNRHTMRIIAN